MFGMKKHKSGGNSQPNLIQFFDTSEDFPSEFKPFPAKRALPDWYKKLHSFDFEQSGSEHKFPTMHNETIKKCVPFLDSMTTGYIIPTPGDIHITKDENGDDFYTWRGITEKITWHKNWQAPSYPKQPSGAGAFPKFTNMFGIKTPPGYSCLFVPPFHHDLPFEIIAGVVDTDTYHHPVNFPFVLRKDPFEGVIEAGTPMAQVIPFRREIWEHGITVGKGEGDDQFHAIRRNVFRSVYRNHFWSRKEYN